MSQRDCQLFARARLYLDVRSNDVHTFYSYGIARSLLAHHAQASEAVVLPAIIFHDVGWKFIPPDKILLAIGPGARHPELVREHEIIGAKLAAQEIEALGLADLPIAQIAGIIDGHDTRREAISLEDALVKDADKIWRCTPHGMKTIGGWFGLTPVEVVKLLHSFVFPTLLTDAGKHMAHALVATAEADIAIPLVIPTEA